MSKLIKESVRISTFGLVDLRNKGARRNRNQPPQAPTSDTAAVRAAGERARIAAQEGGRASTILTDPSKLGEASIGKKVLLGS